MKIAVVAPSSTMNVMSQTMRNLGVSKLNDLGFDVVFGENVDKSLYHTSGATRDRINDIYRFLEDKTVHIIMAAFGGYNSNQLLQYLDYMAISRSGKKFIGYSDTTAILLAINKYSNCQTFHGPSFASFCDPEISDYTVSGFTNIVSGKRYVYRSPTKIAYDKWWLKNNYGPREWQTFDGWKIYRNGKAKGFAIGGNLETLLALAGTAYFPNVKGKILFLEDASGTSAGAFHRGMTQLSQMGVFEIISGLILGKVPNNSPLAESKLISYILEDVIGTKIDYPILLDVNCSHVDPMITFPLNSQISINCTEQAEILVGFD